MKTILIFGLCVLVLPVVASAQTTKAEYDRLKHQQGAREAETQKNSPFLQNLRIQEERARQEEEARKLEAFLNDMTQPGRDRSKPFVHVYTDFEKKPSRRIASAGRYTLAEAREEVKRQQQEALRKALRGPSYIWHCR